MICDSLVIRLCTNKGDEERAEFLHLIDASVRSTFVCIGYFHYSILLVLILVVIYVRRSMKLIKLMEFVVFLPWSRI